MIFPFTKIIDYKSDPLYPSVSEMIIHTVIELTSIWQLEFTTGILENCEATFLTDMSLE